MGLDASWAVSLGDVVGSVIDFTVFGKPQPAGSKRAFVVNGKAVITDANKNAKPWKQEVKACAAEAMAGHGLLDGPLGLTAVFYLARPKGHYRTGKHSNEVKPNAPVFPSVKPDSTKLVRGLEDACTGIVWRDDAQVVAQTVLKRYGDPERVEVTVVRAVP